MRAAARNRLALALSALAQVETGEVGVVRRFGAPVAIHDGGEHAGLHVKAPWPIDSVLRIARRVQSFDLPAVEALTRDPVTKTVDKTLAVDAFVTWRLPDAEAADRFVKTVRTPEQARKLLGPLINGRLAAVISTMPIEDLIGVADDPRAGDLALALARAEGEHPVIAGHPQIGARADRATLRNGDGSERRAPDRIEQHLRGQAPQRERREVPPVALRGLVRLRALLVGPAAQDRLVQPLQIVLALDEPLGERVEHGRIRVDADAGMQEQDRAALAAFGRFEGDAVNDD